MEFISILKPALDIAHVVARLEINGRRFKRLKSVSIARVARGITGNQEHLFRQPRQVILRGWLDKMANETKKIKIEIGDFREAAGIVATNWSAVEDFMEATVWVLVNVKPRYGRALTAHIGFVSQCQIVKLLLADKYPDKFDSEEWKEFAGRIDAMRYARNTIVHARWEKPTVIGGKPALWAHEYKGKNSLRSGIVACSHPYMLMIGGEIEKLTKDLRRYFQQKFSLSPSLYKPESQLARILRPQDKKKIAPPRPPKSYEG